MFIVKWRVTVIYFIIQYMTPRKFKKLVKNFSVAIAIILIWRGTWLLLDYIDIWLFGGSHSLTAISGIIAGVLILYLPDHDLDELGKL